VKGCHWFFRFGVGHVKNQKDEYWVDNLGKLLGKCYVGAESDEAVTKGK
jgi:hypothetical protein